MQIREATKEDIKKIDIMGPKFFKYAQFEKKGLQYNSESFQSFLNMLIEQDNGVLLIAEVDGNVIGTIGGFIAPWMIDFSQTILMETWWWVNSEYHSQGAGTKLINAFIDIGKSKGVDFIIMVTLDHEKESKLIEMYGKMGFQHLEHHYIKRI